MDAVLAIGFIAGIFALGYWIGSMRTKLQILEPKKSAPKPTSRKKVA
jgi:hypothetical protein